MSVQFIELSSETYRPKISVKSQAVYITVMLVFSFIIASFPFIIIPININSPALIRPATEISPVRSLVNGRIKEAFIKENQPVHKGEALYTVESEAISEREKYLLARIEETRSFIADLKNLIHSETPELLTPLFRQSYFNYRQKVTEAVTRYNKVKRDYDRNHRLHREKVIADAEFENYRFELDKAKNDLSLLKQNQLSQWQSELRGYEREQQDFESQLAQLQQDKENLTIKAPVQGSIQNLTGIYPGSMVFANQELAQISPDTSLIVEAYISPNDIGLIKTGMPVRFQVDAFNYNQWGLATGRVLEISNDIHFLNETPVFKVRCLLDKEYLQLKNGYKGYLKKGMTLQARFMVTERTLWQLLYDKMDDWLNPNTFTN